VDPVTSRLAAIAIDCLDTDLMSTFWSTALDVRITSTWTDSHGKRYVELGSGLPENTELVLLLQPVTNHKASKNRLHLDTPPELSTLPKRLGVTLE
jgi:hypothetical protein